MSDETKPVKSRKPAAKKDAEKPFAKRSAAYAHAIREKASRVGAIILLLYQFADNGLQSGRKSGNVLMRNGRGRKMTVPSLVQNAYTSAARALMAAYSQGWNALTDGERASWINMTWLFRSNRFGVPFMVKGKDAYVMLNTNLTNIGGTPITSAPLNAGTSSPVLTTDTALDQSTPTMQIDFDPTPTVNALLVFATAPLSAGINRPKASLFRLIAAYPSATAAALNVQAAYEDKFGDTWRTDAGNAGGKIFFKLVSIEETTGARTGTIIAAGTIVA